MRKKLLWAALCCSLNCFGFTVLAAELPDRTALLNDYSASLREVTEVMTKMRDRESALQQVNAVNAGIEKVKTIQRQLLSVPATAAENGKDNPETQKAIALVKESAAGMQTELVRILGNPDMSHLMGPIIGRLKDRPS